MPIRDEERFKESPVWLGLKKLTISSPSEIAAMAADPVFFNAVLT